MMTILSSDDSCGADSEYCIPVCFSLAAEDNVAMTFG